MPTAEGACAIDAWAAALDAIEARLVRAGALGRLPLDADSPDIGADLTEPARGFVAPPLGPPPLALQPRLEALAAATADTARVLAARRDELAALLRVVRARRVAPPSGGRPEQDGHPSSDPILDARA